VTSIRVVIADDDPDIRALVAIAVRKAGFELVAEAIDGTAAWESVRSARPDLVVLDVSMPGMTGLDVTALIRADAELADVRVALLSAGVDDTSRQAGMDVGADAYLTKPFSPRDLAARLVELAS
jgi:DNA-binding response OmpR family regulator